jgi:urease accessory protein
MARDAERVRDGLPIAFTSLRERPDVPEVVDWVRGVVGARAPA